MTALKGLTKQRLFWPVVPAAPPEPKSDNDELKSPRLLPLTTATIFPPVQANASGGSSRDGRYQRPATEISAAAGDGLGETARR